MKIGVQYIKSPLRFQANHAWREGFRRLREKPRADGAPDAGRPAGTGGGQKKTRAGVFIRRPPPHPVSGCFKNPGSGQPLPESSLERATSSTEEPIISNRGRSLTSPWNVASLAPVSRRPRQSRRQPDEFPVATIPNQAVRRKAILQKSLRGKVMGPRGKAEDAGRRNAGQAAFTESPDPGSSSKGQSRRDSRQGRSASRDRKEGCEEQDG